MYFNGFSIFWTKIYQNGHCDVRTGSTKTAGEQLVATELCSSFFVFSIHSSMYYYLVVFYCAICLEIENGTWICLKKHFNHFCPFLGPFLWIKMPFISKDWRSPGEDWVKYDGGWEKKSIVTIQSYDSCIKENTEHLDLIQQPKVCRRY